MSERRILLESAAFLDSDEAAALGLAEEDARRVARALLAACYGDLGKEPRLLDAEDVRALCAELLPRRLRARDPLGAELPAVLAAFLDHLERTAVVPEAFEARRALDEHAPALVAAVASGELADPAEAPPPFVHGARKLGRNDPCSCGSGKKYKKCHGRGS